MSEIQEGQQEPDTTPIMAGVPVESIKSDGSAGVRCFIHWTVGETTEAELRQVFADIVDKAVEVFKRSNGQVLN